MATPGTRFASEDAGGDIILLGGARSSPPMKVPKGPGNGDGLCSRRLTEGVRRDGTKFRIVDSWKRGGSAHRLLPFVWTGHSVCFYEKVCAFIV